MWEPKTSWSENKLMNEESESGTESSIILGHFHNQGCWPGPNTKISDQIGSGVSIAWRVESSLGRIGLSPGRKILTYQRSGFSTRIFKTKFIPRQISTLANANVCFSSSLASSLSLTHRKCAQWLKVQFHSSFKNFWFLVKLFYFSAFCVIFDWLDEDGREGVVFAVLEWDRDSEGCEQSRRRMQCHGTNDYAERHPYEISFLSFKTILCFEEKLKSSLSSHCQTAPAVTTSTTLDTIGGFQVASFNFPKFAFSGWTNGFLSRIWTCRL